MNATRYGDYSRDVSGWFLGMTGAQLALVTLAGVPALLALNAQTWGLLLVWLPVWALLAAVLLVPVRGRAKSAGTPARVTRASWAPVMPRNHPETSRE